MPIKKPLSYKLFKNILFASIGFKLADYEGVNIR